MRYSVVVRRSIGNAPDVVVAQTRRYLGAVAEADRWLDSARANAKNHNPDGRVVTGPTDNPDSWAVVSLFPDGFTVVDSVHVVQRLRDA